jgi:hypothetical protein
MGDFNLDFMKPEGSTSYGQILQTNYVNHHPDLATWHSGNSHSRIDYILTSKDIFPFTSNPKTKQTPKQLTDHSRVSLIIDFNLEPRGRGQWILNNSILNDTDFIIAINQVLSTAFSISGPFHKIPIKMLSVDDYELIKQALRETCIWFSKEKARQDSKMIKELEKELDRLLSQSHRVQLSENDAERLKTIENLFFFFFFLL